MASRSFGSWMLSSDCSNFAVFSSRVTCFFCSSLGEQPLAISNAAHRPILAKGDRTSII